MEIKNTKDLKGKPKVNMLLYGAPGTGKTTIAGTFPKPLYLNIEAGVNTLIDAGVDYVDIEVWEDIKEVYNLLVSKELKHESVIIDSVTELMKKRKLELQGKRESMRIQDWGLLVNEIEEMMRRFRDLPQHAVFIFAENEVNTDEGVLKRPSVSGKSLPTTAAGFVDLVGYTKVSKDKTIQFLTQFTPDGSVYAKSRFPNIKGDIENTSFKLLTDLMKGGAIKEKQNPKIAEVLEKKKSK